MRWTQGPGQPYASGSRIRPVQPCDSAGPGMGSRPRLLGNDDYVYRSLAPPLRPGGGITLTSVLSRQGRGGRRPARRIELAGDVLAPLRPVVMAPPGPVGGGAGSDPDECAFGRRDAGLSSLVDLALHPDAFALWLRAAASFGAESSSDRLGMCRGVLPDVLAVRVAHLAGYPVADFVVVIVVVVFGVEGGGNLVVCLDELVDGVGRVLLGVGDLAVDVVGAALGVRVFLVVCFGG